MEKYCLSVSYPSVSEDSLSRVISHPTILEDCSDFFDSLDRKRALQGLSPIERIPAIDSAAACKTLVTLPDSTGTGVVCCQEAAELYNLRVIAPSIGNDRNSETRYLIMAKFSQGFVDPFGLSCATTSRDDLKATISLSLKNIAGAMFRMTSCFALRDLNVYKVETRPSSAAIGLQGVQASGDRFKHWDLIFFIDYQPSDHEAINEALRRNLEEYSVWVVDLGVYRQYGQRQTTTEPSEWTNMVDILATA
jgi:prephenate dehydratase